MLRLRFSIISALILAMTLGPSQDAEACTGISLKAKDGSNIIARTMEWGTFVLNSRYVIVPRNYSQVAITPSGTNGMKFVSKYGYVGISALEDRFVAEGMNEEGLVAELFYFPSFGEYEKYNPVYNSTTIMDIQLISWMLGNFATIAELEEALKYVHIIPYEHGFDAVHWNVADKTGRQVVIEMSDGKARLYENKVGVITNAPGFEWHMINLNNYVNVFAGVVDRRQVAPGVELYSLGMGSASIGLPGDLTPPSRFVRAAFYKLTARPQQTGDKAVLQAFQILNNFDIPVGAEFRDDSKLPDFLSATQWTTASDQKALKFYYKTEWNYSLRCIDLNEINFAKVRYQTGPLDKVQEQPIEYIKV